MSPEPSLSGDKASSSFGIKRHLGKAPCSIGVKPKTRTGHEIDDISSTLQALEALTTPPPPLPPPTFDPHEPLWEWLEGMPIIIDQKLMVGTFLASKDQKGLCGFLCGSSEKTFQSWVYKFLVTCETCVWYHWVRRIGMNFYVPYEYVMCWDELICVGRDMLYVQVNMDMLCVWICAGRNMLYAHVNLDMLCVQVNFNMLCFHNCLGCLFVIISISRCLAKIVSSVDHLRFVFWFKLIYVKYGRDML
jgi:hypothetical protein